jgi:mono/diheme cytochrome c family protein
VEGCRNLRDSEDSNVRRVVQTPPKSRAARTACIAALAVAGLAAVLGGCASQVSAERTARIARGEAIAQSRCSGCHGLGPTDKSTFPGAPPFRDMPFNYNQITYQRAMAEYHKGRVTMPPATLTLDEITDIGAYIYSLKGPQRAATPQ